MTVIELIELIKEGEGYNLEFKQSVPSKLRDLMSEVCAFVNAAGGTLIIGVTDSNEIVGVAGSNQLRSRITDAINEIEPAPQVTYQEFQLDGKTLIVLECQTGKDKPYALSGSIYVRNGPNSEKITSVEKMREFFHQSGKIFFDSAPCKSFDFDNDFDQEAFDLFLSKAGISQSLPTSIILRNLQLISDDKIVKNGAALFFAKNVTKYFDQAIIRCVEFNGIERLHIIDDKTFSGNLIHQYESAVQFLLTKLRLSYIIDDAGPRKEIQEIPETAYREAIINALTHRDYYEKGAVTQVEVYDDRIEISNPGGLISTISKEEFGFKSFSRNPLLSGLFLRMRLVEKLGTGIKRIRDTMSESGLPEPEFKMTAFFTVVLHRPMNFDKWLLLWDSSLNETRMIILREMHRNPKLSKSKLSILLGMSITALDKHLTALKEIGVLERVGGDKGGHWNVIFKAPPK